MAELVERLLPTPEIHSSDQVIGKFLLPIDCNKSVLKRRKQRKKRPGIAHFFRNNR